jgi:hypothetical protein
MPPRGEMAFNFCGKDVILKILAIKKLKVTSPKGSAYTNGARNTQRAR